MDRRGFLKLLLAGATVTAAGLYTPKTLYSFPSEPIALNAIDLECFDAALKACYAPMLLDLLSTPMPFYERFARA